MSKFTIISCLLLLGALYFDYSLAHTHNGLCTSLYVDPNLQGQAYYNVCNHLSVSNLPVGYDNQISSVNLPTGYNMRLYLDANGQGKWMDIKAGVYNLATMWNDTVSSVFYNNWGDGCANFYSGPNQSGTNFLACSTGNLVPGWNQDVASVYVAPGHNFRLYKDYNWQGEWIDVRGKWTAREGEWVNQVKSMKLKHSSACAFFHQYANQGGRLFQVCDDGNLPSPWNTTISSITVPADMNVTIFNHADYTGNSLKLITGTYNLDSTWDKKVVSVKVILPPDMN